MKRTMITTGTLLTSSLVMAMAFSSTAMAQAKNTSTTPQVDVENAQPNAISYGSTRSNKQIPSIKSPAGAITEKAIEKSNADGLPYKLGRLHLNMKTIAVEQEACVTVDETLASDCENAISYDTTQSNKQMPNIKSQASKMPEAVSEPSQLKEGDYPLMAGWFMAKHTQANVNTMSLNALTENYDIDEKTALKILDFRAKNPIRSFNDLRAAGLRDSMIERFIDTETANKKTTRESLKTFARTSR